MNGLIRGIAYCFLLLPNLLVLSAAHGIVGFGAWGNVFAFSLYAAVLFLVILVHEAGHATAAIIFGWRVTLFAVFPFAYRAKTGRLSFWIASSGDLGGAVAVSSKGHIRTPFQSMILFGAGPLANFLLAIISYAVIYLVPQTQSISGSLAVASLFVGLGNLLPWRAKGGSSDGARILSLFTRRDRSFA